MGSQRESIGLKDAIMSDNPNISHCGGDHLAGRVDQERPVGEVANPVGVLVWSGDGQHHGSKANPGNE